MEKGVADLMCDVYKEYETWRKKNPQDHKIGTEVKNHR